MFFAPNVPLENIQKWIAIQLPAVHNVSKRGIEVNIIPHKSKRTCEQNRFLMVVCTQIARLHHETGYCCPGLKAWAMQPAILKEYFKARYGIESTSKMDVSEFIKFIDFIQNTMVEETGGEYEMLQTDSAYLKSLTEDSFL